MIPRKIHYCWFSHDPFPSLVLRCIESWHQYMPDWEFVLWDYDKIKDIDSIWLKECISVQKWAFAADFIRLWAIYHEGGIYLDSDVMVYRPFDEFLHNHMFIGREGAHYVTFDDGIQVFLTSHCFGSEAGHPFLKLNLEYYKDRHFVQCASPNVPNILRYDMLMMPYIQSRLAESYGYNPGMKADHIQQLSVGVTVYPEPYFGYNDKAPVPDSCYAWHVGQASWREKEYFDKPSHNPSIQPIITLRYKIRWRIVRLVRYFATKLGYIMIKIEDDGFE